MISIGFQFDYELKSKNHSKKIIKHFGFFDFFDVFRFVFDFCVFFIFLFFFDFFFFLGFFSISIGFQLDFF